MSASQSRPRGGGAIPAYRATDRGRRRPSAGARQNARRGPLRAGRGAPGRRPEQAGDSAANGDRPAHRRHVAHRRPLPRARPSSRRPTCVDPFAEFLAARVAAGEANAAQLTRELVACGYPGSYQAVRQAVTCLRLRVRQAGGEVPDAGHRLAEGVPTAVDRVSPRQAAWLLR
jgi:hypothetical protein